MKRLFVGLTFALLLSLIPMELFGTTASAAAYGCYTYTVYDGEARITGCDNAISGDITIPAQIDGYPVTSIGGNAFRLCSNMTSVTIPDSVVRINDYAFADCGQLKQVTIGDGVTSIGKHAFESCDNLTNVIIGDGVTSIGSYAFYCCIKLGRVTIGDSVTSIGAYAFEGCQRLTSINIPTSVTSIGECAFRGCLILTDVFYDGTAEEWGRISIGSSNNALAVRSCRDSESGCYYTLKNGTVAIIGALVGSSGELTIPDTIAGVSVTSIERDAFEGCNDLISVTIGNRITDIGNDAFRNCSNLTTVTFRCSVTSISDFMFQNCSSLISITIPNSVTSIGNYAFSGCTSLVSISIPSRVASLSVSAFSKCSNLTGIWVDKNNANFSSDASGVLFDKNKTKVIQMPAGFSGKYIIPDSVSSIGGSAFSNCSSLIGISIPNSVTSIGSFAFSDCSSLTSITIPDGVTSIPSYVFRNCSSLTGISIPNSVTSIGNYAFGGCSDLDHVVYAGNQPQWQCVEVGTNNGDLSGASQFHYETIFEYIESCTETSVYCPICQVVVAEIVKPGGKHSFISATCTTSQICAVCNLVVGEPLGHTYNTVVIEPTCTEPGSMTSTCTVCGDVVTKTLDAKGHSGDQWFELAPLTCTTDGIKARICSTCGTTEIKTFLATGHSNTSVVTPPTCEDKGYTTNTCIACGLVTVTDYVDATGHAYSTVEIAPTCTEKGSATKTCATCGDVVIEEIAAKGHGWSAWIQIAAPSCTAEGSRVRFCNCGARETEVLPKLPHSFENDACTVCSKKSVDLKITAVTLRPEAAGLYFTGSFEIAEDVSVVRQGIVVSVYSSLPVADGSDPNSLWSAGTTSVMVKNILKANLKDTSNQNRAAMSIYARAYVELADGTYVYSDVATVNLQEVVEAADAQWATLNNIQKEAFLAMYKKFQVILQAWSIPNVKKI